MADIRINALATTAASTASDDFVAVDGSANGTRKLNAFSPTFGGNLTVSGTGNSSVAGNFGLGTTTPTAGQLHISGNSDSGSAPNRPRIGLTNLAGTAQTWTIQAWQTSGDANLSIYRTAAAGGILLASTGGRVGVGVTSFSGSGALELATHTTSAGGIGFGTDVSLYRPQAGVLAIDGSAAALYLRDSGTTKGRFNVTGSTLFIDGVDASGSTGQIILRTGNGGGTALTLDSSQRCILAGALRLNNAYTAGAPTATGYVTLQDSAGNTYKVLVGT